MCSYDPSWAALIRRQDALMRFERPIENHDALTLGLYAVEAARELGHNLSIRVIATRVAFPVKVTPSLQLWSPCSWLHSTRSAVSGGRRKPGTLPGL